MSNETSEAINLETPLAVSGEILRLYDMLDAARDEINDKDLHLGQGLVVQMHYFDCRLKDAGKALNKVFVQMQEYLEGCNLSEVIT